MAEISQFPARPRAPAIRSQPTHPESKSLVDQRAAEIRAVLFDELRVSPKEPGVVTHKAALSSLGFGMLGTKIYRSCAADWRANPAYFAALVLIFEERTAAAAFFLPPQFHP